jgi:hypothetical protein
MSLQSYEILGLRYDATILDVKRAFKKLALKTHPDHGGSPALFMTVKRAYKDVLSVFDQPTFETMKKQSAEDAKEQTKDLHKPLIDPKKFNAKKFNQVFEKFRVEAPSDRGYDLSKDVVVHAKDYDNCLIEYTEPDVILSTGQFTQIGQRHIADYTAPFNAKVKYTDVMRATAVPVEESFLTTPEKTGRSVKGLTAERGNLSYSADTRQSEQYNRIQQERLQLESIRQQNDTLQTTELVEIGRRMRNYTITMRPTNTNTRSSSR